MVTTNDRRRFLSRTAQAGALLSLGDLGFLSRLPSVSAAEVASATPSVALRPEIAGVVRMIETTPRAELLEKVAAQIASGLSYRELLAGLLLAGVKNVEPRPSVGHKFHSVLVVNSAHLASISSPPEHRWLPIFWALDYYKSAAARDVEERGDWTMSRVNESNMPPARKARTAFVAAMDNWDVEAADVAVARLARSAGINEIYELLFRYGGRDFRSIGHKAIFVANSWRTLQCIGSQHAEPVLRSLAYALLMHEEGNPAQRDADADRPFRKNQELVGKIRPDWREGKVQTDATREFVTALRTVSNNEASNLVVEQLNAGVAAQSIWDALHVAAGEMLMKQPGIIALHAVTTTNAMSFAYRTSGGDETRRLLMLQNAAFLTMFRDRMGGRGPIANRTIDTLQAEPPVEPKGEFTAEAIFGELNDRPQAAANRALAHLRRSGNAKDLIDAARLLIFLKGNNAHDYKFSSAVLEDYYHVSPAWRDIYFASNIFGLRGSASPDNQLVSRTRAALGG